MSVFPLIMLVHFIADFILQSDWMAKNKSKSNKALLIHIAVYTLALMVFGIKFAIINGVIHMLIDYFTSRMTSRLWQQQKSHEFFVVIGLDQYLHFLTLWFLCKEIL